jgi:hypothetical protein
MTASDISSIALTIVTIQIGCDLWFNWRVYHTESYRRALNALERANVKLQRERDVMEKEQEKAILSTATSKQAQKNNDRWKKRWQRAQDDHAEAVALVAQKHTAPNIYTSILFVLLMRILGTEHSGKVLGVLPFSVPFAFIRRFITSRGLQFELSDDAAPELITLTTQACSFFFIYFLCGLSVKFYASKLIGVQPPKGAEGLNAIMQSPQGRKLARSMGVDPDELKNA